MGTIGWNADFEDCECICGISRHPRHVLHNVKRGETGVAVILHDGACALWMEPVLVDTNGHIHVPKEVSAPRHPKPNMKGFYPDARKPAPSVW
jgi:hypothetical protein